MSLDKVGAKALAVANLKDISTVDNKKPKKILSEEEYEKNVEKIVVRDFYPDLPKLHAQAEFIEALEKNDTAKLREIHIKYGPKRPVSSNVGNIYATPSTFETPVNAPKQTPAKEGEEKEAGLEETKEPTHNPELPQKKELSDLPLDKFLSRVTNEDDASYEEIQNESEKKRVLKHAWLYEQEGTSQEQCEQRLALPSIEEQASASNPGQIDMWRYRNKNALMYPPEGVKLSQKELVEKAVKSREIQHPNTRFHNNPFNLEKSKASIHQAASQQAAALHGKIGSDGKEILPTESPQVNGYGFMATPSPAPGVEESPLMTWGEIEGTPFRLDGGDTPNVHKTPGPSFKIPAIPKRDRLAHELAEQASAAHRAKKEAAMKNVRANINMESPKFGTTSKTNRLAGMSPAAQRLASSKLGIRSSTDKALKSSYTPSPSPKSTPGAKTPRDLTPGRSVRKEPSSIRITTPKRNVEEVASLTDNLLKLPKRAKAQEFF